METLQGAREQNRTARHITVANEDLRETDLSGLRADALELREVDLRKANLSDVRFRNSTLADVRLDGALCRGAVLRMCKLEELRAARSDFTGAKIENSEGRGAVFDDANLEGASLADSDFGRASFRGARLDGVRASGVDLRGADLRGASLRGACLAEVDLRGADLTGANLDGADLRHADLRGTILDESACRDEDEPEAAPLPPALVDLATVVGPLLTGLFQRGHAQGLFDPAEHAKMLEALRRSGFAGEGAAPPHLDAAITSALQRVAETGVGPLLEALQQRNGPPPPAIAAMLQNLAADLELGENATAEDLLARLLESSRKARRA